MFFAFSPESAKVFGNIVYDVEVANPKLFIGVDEKHAGIDAIDKTRERHLAEMLVATAKEGKIDLYRTDIYIPDKPYEDLDWVYEVVRNGGLLWDLLDDENFVNKMKSLGYDGTAVEELDLPEKRSLFICNLDKIKIVGKHGTEL